MQKPAQRNGTTTNFHHLDCATISAVTAFLLLFVASLPAQSSVPDAPSSVLMAEQDHRASEDASSVARSGGAVQSSKTATPKPAAGHDSEGKQPKRILYIIPNYRSVSANTTLPPQSAKEKFILATQDSFDYSSFLLAGALAGLGQVQGSYPEFRQGAAGYGRYYWHSFADQAVGNYFTEAIVPVLTREDARYYTLGHGGLLPRAGYAVTRLLITRKDSGGRTFNFSEIVGNGAGASVSALYYPSRERTWTKTGQKWITQIALDGVFNVFKEFWPDISHHR